MNPVLQQVLTRLRESTSAAHRSGVSGQLAADLDAAGIGFAAVGGRFEQRWLQALSELQSCLSPLGGQPNEALREGGPYDGAWLESTGTISAEMLSRFSPTTAQATLGLFAEHQRNDGMIPYKVTAAGPGYTQIQLVSPLARSVWNHYLLHGGSTGGIQWLEKMYRAMARYDDWLMEHRNTRGTSAVEAFCTFDTGHDLSPRFWFAPDRCPDGDATRYDPQRPTVPYLAPDLTANVACQREYLGRIAQELGEDPEPWSSKWEGSIDALFEYCFDPEDDFFYDRDATGSPVKVQSDVLLRVLACEVGDEELFDTSLRRYLMNTAKFLSHYGFTSIALDDPRFDADATRNSWAGPVNFLSLLRAPHAFEHRGRTAELALAAGPVLEALTDAESFPQCLDPFSGEAGYTGGYSPAILWYLDAVERYFGILPVSGTKRSWTRADGEPGIWFTGLAPTQTARGHSETAAAVAYSRQVGDMHYELAADEVEVVTFCNGQQHLRFPRGWRVETDLQGTPSAAVGVSGGLVDGELRWHGQILRLQLGPNERAELNIAEDSGELREGQRRRPGFVAPQWN